MEPETEAEREPDPGLDAPARAEWTPQEWVTQPFATAGRQLRRRNKSDDEAAAEQQLAPKEISENIHRKPRKDRGQKRK